MACPSSNAKSYLTHLDDCIFPNEHAPINKKKIDEWIDDFSIVAESHVIEYQISPSGSIPTDTNPANTNGTAKRK